MNPFSKLSKRLSKYYSLQCETDCELTTCQININLIFDELQKIKARLAKLEEKRTK